ncbi:MAG: hypothetical protein ACLR8Y_14355 [Alistipes indistinctus]
MNWTLTLPETASYGTVSDVTALFTNINTSTTYKGTVTSVTKATVLTVSATVPKACIRLVWRVFLSYTATDGSRVTSGFRAYQESIAIAGETATIPEAQTSFHSPSEGFVISEVFLRELRLIKEINTVMTSTLKSGTIRIKYFMPIV